MEERYSYSNLWRSLRNGDFQEEDVWGFVKETQDSLPNFASKSKNLPVSVPRPIPSAARMIPRTGSSSNSTTSNNNINNNSSMSHDVKVVQQSSAPVNIPDWSKIYGNKSKKTSKNHVASWLDAENGKEDEEDSELENDYEEDGDGDDGDEDEIDYKMPPHEFIARRLERSQISSFSVFEGIGRTLKGRDLSKVRNAVLIKTGFLESL